MRIAGVSFGDRHGGLKNGLIRPGTKLVYGVGEQREEVEVLLSDWSKWLWDEVWLPSVEFAKAWAGDDPLILADSGDAVHGSKFVENLYSPHINHQIEISQEALRPWKELSPALYLLAFGTGSHDYGSNAAAILLSEKLAPWGWQVKTDNHLRMMLTGMFFDLAHHGPGVSSRPHLVHNSARNYAMDIVRRAVDYGERYPALIQRGHVHQNASLPVTMPIGLTDHQTHILVTPPMCGPNGYARQASNSVDYVKCGVYFWEIIDGKLGRVEPFIVVKDTRSVYVIDDFGTQFFNNMVEDRGNKRKKGKKKL